MQMTQSRQPTSIKAKAMIVAAIAAVAALGAASVPLLGHALSNDNMTAANTKQIHDYTAYIRPLNHTNVSGTAQFKVSGNHLMATIDATGLEPGVHPQHIHGKEQAAAECPTVAADLNKDGFISVVEGAPSYGLIKMNLTSPQTTFGTPPTPALFAPFAGTADNANFPVVGSNGILHFTHTYTFDNSAAAQAALKSLTPLGDQELVLHGATAPKSVDADAFAALGKPYEAGTNLSVAAYDALLPAGCGEIDEATTSPGNNNGNNGDNNMGNDKNNTPVVNPAVEQLSSRLGMTQSNLLGGLTTATDGVMNSAAFTTNANSLSANFSTTVNTAVTDYRGSVANGGNKDEARNQLINSLASAKDKELNLLTEQRNTLIDTLNRSGNTSGRDAFLNGYEQAVNQYAHVIEQAKNQL